MTEVKENGRVLLVKRQEKILTLLYNENRLVRANAYCPKEDVLDNIYIGKVKNVVQNIQAAFVEFSPGQLCFLSLLEAKKPIIVNRSYDGRIVAGDEIVIQITAEKQKAKEASADTNLSFTGKYLVLSTGKRQLGYSPRLSSVQKEQLKVFVQNNPCFARAGIDYGLVFRTNIGELKDFSILEQELQVLEQELQTVLQTAGCRTCYSCLRKSPPVYLKSLKDFYSKDYEKIITDDAMLYEEAKQYLMKHQRDDLEKLSFYEDALLPLSKLYSVESRLAEALNRKVWMKSGGYLVIDKTEALTCIDVNSGKAIGKKSKSETCFQINMEAAREIAIQLKLRNISGIIIIDFINMDKESQNKALIKHLKEILSEDSVKTVVVDMTPLGLVEVTRKKEKKSLWEQLQE